MEYIPYICIFLILYYLLQYLLYNGDKSVNNELSPYGVNLGGMFVLEDWFLSDSKTTTEVDTKYEIREAVVKNIYPSYKNKYAITEKFFGECDLISILKEDFVSDKDIFESFQEHRINYLSQGQSYSLEETINKLFKEIKSKGIGYIRLPITWCLIYDDTYELEGILPDGTKQKVQINSDSRIVKDPYFTDKYWTGILINDIKLILEKAASNGLEVLIDFHTFLGGSSGASYSGTWNENTRFWNDNTIAIQNMEIIMDKFCKWITNDNQSLALNGLYGISPMNEPAHLAGIDVFYSRYPDRWKNKEIRLQEIKNVLEKAIYIFKQNNLQPKKLVMNIIETSTADFGDDQFKVWGDWWKSELNSSNNYGYLINKKDREEWAGIDIHHYEAWNPCEENPCCSEEIIKGYQGNSDIKKHLLNNLHKCYEHVDKDWVNNWVWSGENISTIKDQVIDGNDLFYTSEFSNSLQRDTKYSYISNTGYNSLLPKDKITDIIKLYLKNQNHAFHENNIKAFFWTWDVPYNKNYQNEWSLKHILNNT